MRKSLSLLLATGLMTCLSLGGAHAQDWHGHDHDRDFHGGGWYGHGDIHDFHDHDFDHWRSGVWFHGFHDGRDGWWWQVGGVWYYYPAPVYPYPDPYTPPTVVVTQAAPGTVAYYYCSNPAGYYPYVPQCYAPWQRVDSAAPAPASPPVAVVAPAAGTRSADIAQLNAYSAELQAIDPHDPTARAHLTDLGKRVGKFRQALFHRAYNAADVVKDAEDLQHRIKIQKDITAHTAQLPVPVMQPPPIPMPVPVPVPVPPQQ